MRRRGSPTCSRTAASLAPRGGRTRAGIARISPASSPNSPCSVCTRWGAFTAPSTPDGITGYHFLRTPRPGQGCLTGRPTLGLMLVLISPRRPEQAQALRDWADFVHIRHIAEAGVPGYSMITPYENVTGGDPRFMHFYEMDTDDPGRAFQSMTPLVSERIGQPGTPAWDAWANTPELRIMYVNTFRRVGERPA